MPFNHEGEVSVNQREGRSYLVQNGQLYTYAEYNIGTKKWEPEPRPVDELMMISEGVEELLRKVIKILEPVLKTTRALDEFSKKALEKRTELKNSFNRLNGVNMQLRQ